MARGLALSFFLFLLAGCGQSDKGSQGPELTVEVDGKGSCFVRETTVPCNQLAEHMRDTMKVPLQTYIAVSPASESTPAGDIIPVIQHLEDAGFKLVIGSIAVGPNKPLQPLAPQARR